MPSLDLLSLLVGPIASVSGSSSLGPSFAQYERDFATYDDSHWATDGANWDSSNYYDRAFINYVWYARTGDSTYLGRANAIAADYLENYVEANNYGVASWWSMPKGIAAHYLLNGDQASLTAIGKMADQVVNPWNTENNWANLFDPHQSEGREQARALETLTLAILIDAPSVGVPNIQPNGEDWGVSGGNDFRALAKSLVEKILMSGFQHADGSRPHYVDGAALDGAPIDKPFMNGLMNEALMNYYEQVDPDPRIVQFIKANLNYMWAYEWDATAAAFQYIDKDSVDGVEDLPAADLNMLIVNGFGFVYRHTGDATYLYRGDLVFAGGVEGNWLEGSKQFNQQYTSSYKYIAYTRDELSLPQPLVETDGASMIGGAAPLDLPVDGHDHDTTGGLGAADGLDGEDGNPQLSDGAGDDMPNSAPGDEGLAAEAGADTVADGTWLPGASYWKAGHPVVVDMNVDGALGTASAHAHTGNHVALSNFNDVVWGDTHKNLLWGHGGNDHLRGGAGHDRLFGGAGEDTLDGGAGRDVLVGGAGADLLLGRTGADVFLFRSLSHSAASARDTIGDLVGGVDKIDLRQIDANALLSQNQAFSFVGNHRFSGQAGELHFIGRMLSGDVDGDAIADFAIQVDGESSLAATDFVL